MIYTSKSTQDTQNIGFELAKKLYTGGNKSAVVAMQGEMGVGKTAFTLGFASFFEIRGVKSPTYAVMNQYSGQDIKIYHFDMYRINDEDELYSIGYDDYIEAQGYKIIEWSENIEYALPTDTIFVKISRVPEDEGSRTVEIFCKEDLI